MLQGLVEQTIPVFQYSSRDRRGTPHITLAKLGLQDDLEAFLELYEGSVLA